jgi:hypothetical protein
MALEEPESKPEAGPGRDEFLADVQQEIETGHEIVVVWRPRRSTPVTISFIEVNGVLITRDTADFHSPFIAARLPRPHDDGTFEINWGIAPEVGVDAMAMVVRRRDGRGATLVDTKGAVARGDVWFARGKKVNAP